MVTSNADLEQGAIMTVSSLYTRWERNGFLHDGQHLIENCRVVESVWANIHICMAVIHYQVQECKPHRSLCYTESV